MSYAYGFYRSPEPKTLEELKVKRQSLRAKIVSMEWEIKTQKRCLEKLEQDIKKSEEIRRMFA